MYSELISQLKDIQGLDIPPWWYLEQATVIFWLLVVILILVILHLRRRPKKNHWHADARQQLNKLKTSINVVPDKQVISDLSELLRRIAMARIGRQRCAGLWGDAWLQWLTDNDPHGFDWVTQGKILLDIPYASVDVKIEKKNIILLISATRTWIK